MLLNIPGFTIPGGQRLYTESIPPHTGEFPDDHKIEVTIQEHAKIEIEIREHDKIETEIREHGKIEVEIDEKQKIIGTI